ncbi:MIP family Ig-specific serine endopeptidase [Mycoplasmopsis agassizii]|uniref:DUF31 domain-containing protein n=1 Tax=Mycoplasmopsis agassizii TaxID=33922 RepID=A0ABX4H536_9BACT|nr:DUF31 family protein [Mycoplasmopsis agassizii]PAF55005.1 hypothetical protein CJF60_04710 [Mycoplasmopsis agassizii]SMC17580.1 Putative peptidase [Mycoplasmopsis agassizii]
MKKFKLLLTSSLVSAVALSATLIACTQIENPGTLPPRKIVEPAPTPPKTDKPPVDAKSPANGNPPSTEKPPKNGGPEQSKPPKNGEPGAGQKSENPPNNGVSEPISKNNIDKHLNLQTTLREVNNKEIETKIDPKISANEIYKNIYDRTFSIRFSIQQEDAIVASRSYWGTSWLLDYHKDEVDENQITLYLATNVHVVSEIGNSSPLKDAGWDYSSNKAGEVKYVSLGKLTEAPIFNPLNQEENNIKFANNQRQTSLAHFYTNSNKGNQIGTQISAITAPPRLIFAAVDFMDKSVSDQLSDMHEKWNSSTRYQADSDRKSVDQLGFFKDFAVVAVDVDLSKKEVLNKGASAPDTNEKINAEFESWIKNAMKAVDETINLVKTKKLPNNDGVRPYVTYDIPSTLHDNEENAKEAEKYNAKTEYDNVYILGYPVSDGFAKIKWNNNEARYSEANKNLKAIARLDETYNIITDYKNVRQEEAIKKWEPDALSLDTFFKKWYIDYYGYQMRSKFSEMGFGASGSLVMTDYGLPLGIHYSSSDSDDSASSVYELFVQARDEKVKIVSTNKDMILYKYNLFDKTGNEKQITSYRSNLKAIIDSENKGVYKTALFPEGV